MGPTTFTLLLASLIAAALAASSKPASYYFEICHTSDPKFNECVKNLLTKMRPQFIKGIPALNLQPIDPLKITKMEMGERNGNFKLYQKLTNILITGMGAYKLESTKFDHANKRYNVTLLFPKLKLEADYEIDGQILILPIKGNGKVTYNFENLNTFSDLQLETFEKNKKTYVRIKDYKIRMEPEHAKSHFTNLFNGDKALGDSTNKFLNDNWRDAFDTFSEPFQKAFIEILKTITNNVYSKFPENEIFPK